MQWGGYGRNRRRRRGVDRADENWVTLGSVEQGVIEEAYTSIIVDVCGELIE